MGAILAILLFLFVYGSIMQLWQYYILGNRGTPTPNKEAVLRELSRRGIINESQYVRAAKDMRLNRKYLLLDENYDAAEGLSR